MPGVGILFNGAASGFLERHPGAVDHLAVIPDRAWVDHGRDARPRFVPLAEETAQLAQLAARHTLVAHGVGLSIASAGTFDRAHLRELCRWRHRFGFAWVSEHLSAVRVPTEETVDHHAGLALPLPWDAELLDLLAPRIAEAQDLLGDPLLLENGVVHTPVPGCEMSEAEFLNALVERTGCALLLDLHNLHVNAVNLGDDPYAFLGALDLRGVREIHVAGGNTMFGLYLDSHAGACPERVWELLAWTAPRCPNLRGVTFEYHESYAAQLTEAGLLEQLRRMRACLTAPMQAAA